MSSQPDDALAQGKRAILRHALATLAYRGGKAIRDAAPSVPDFHASEKTRTPLQILAHLGDLLDWALSLAEGNQRWHVATPGSWDEESARFFAALGRLDLVKGHFAEPPRPARDDVTDAFWQA